MKPAIDWAARKLDPKRIFPAKNQTCYVYTHAYPDGRVFYVGSGHGYRYKNFNNRSKAHKLVLKELGKANVLITVYEVKNSMLQFYEERLMIKRCLLDGANLIQTIPVDVMKEVQEIKSLAK